MTNKGEILKRFWVELEALSSEGGWIFWALILLAFGIAFSMGTIWRSLSWRETSILTGKQWQKLFGNWEKEGELITQLRNSVNGTSARGMEEIEQSLFAKAKRRIPFAFVLIGAAPLVGLLGTVSGMMNTFHGMAAASSAAPIETISRGISEALITTQTGLIIGVPSLIVCTILKSKLDQRVLIFQQIEVQVVKAIN
jgi:biopolymer transport protein ExbB